MSEFQSDSFSVRPQNIQSKENLPLFQGLLSKIFHSYHANKEVGNRKLELCKYHRMQFVPVKTDFFNIWLWSCILTLDEQEMLTHEKAQGTATVNEEVDLDDLMDDPGLERLHADRIAALKKEAEKRESLKQKGHGEYREITEGDFLGEVTGSEKAVCHFYHREFYRCKIMDKHLKALAALHIGTKFIKLDAENAPFFVGKLGVKMLPSVILFRNGITNDRIVGFQELGSKDDFATKALENLLKKKGIIDARKEANDDEEDIESSRTIRSSAIQDSDSD